MRTKVYIDGQNFMYKAASILIESDRITDKNDLTKIDIRGVIEHIVGKDVSITYYGAKVNVRKDKGEDIAQKTRNFSDVARRIRNTLNAQNIVFNESGKLKVRDSDNCKKCSYQDLRMQEKGVDVGIAVDIVSDSLRHDVDKIVLVSSDTDLIPAIKVAKETDVKVVYIGFNNKLTKAIVSESHETEVIRDNEVIDAFDRLN